MVRGEREGRRMSRRYPRIPAAWITWTYQGRLYHRAVDGTILVRQTPRHTWTPSAWPRG